MKGWAINMMQEFQGGPKRVRVHTTTEHPTSSYNIPVWVDSKGNSYGQVQFGGTIGWQVIPDPEEKK